MSGYEIKADIVNPEEIAPFRRHPQPPTEAPAPSDPVVNSAPGDETDAD